jgi:crotonobetainyl-CoA:carnitine CoA-transferase CaiB-like acyl-CoA transferase
MLNAGTAYDFIRTSDGRYISVEPIAPKFFKNFCVAASLIESLELQFFAKEDMD